MSLTTKELNEMSDETIQHLTELANVKGEVGHVFESPNDYTCPICQSVFSAEEELPCGNCGCCSCCCDC